MKELEESNANICSDDIEITAAEGDDNINSLETNTADNNSLNSTYPKRQRKKRKVSSCDRCRRVKTRCDFEPLMRKCHRCVVLKLDCSLESSNGNELISSQTTATGRILKLPTNSTTASDPAILQISSLTTPTEHPEPEVAGQSNSSISTNTHRIDNRLEQVEKDILNLNSKIDKIISLLEGKSTSESKTTPLEEQDEANGHQLLTTKSNPESTDLNKKSQLGKDPELETTRGSVRMKLKEYPFKILNDIDERLFPLTASSQQEAIEREQRPSAVARVNFLHFYEHNKNLCHKLVKEFLTTSQFYIVPTGMKELDPVFARDHLFITSVYTIIAMSNADNDEFTKKQESLYPLVERLLTNTLTMFDKLKAQDLEAILYCSMFHVSRKAKRHRQLKFNSLILSNFALFSLLNNFDFDQIKNRVNNQEFNETDLYHLRLLNALTACNLEYSLIYGTISPKDSIIRQLNNLVTNFPESNDTDTIKLSEINLADIVIDIFGNFQEYFQRFLKDNLKTRKTSINNITVFEIIELSNWVIEWDNLLHKSDAGILKFHYHFYHIMICRSFLNEFLTEMKEHPEFLDGVIHTMKYHATCLLDEFLKLPATLIKGAPKLTTNELIYTCLTLCDYLYWFDVTERQEILNMCTKVYWHLNTIGEKLNEITDNMAKIIKSIIDTTRSQATNMNKSRISIVNLVDKTGGKSTSVPSHLTSITSRIERSSSPSLISDRTSNSSSPLLQPTSIESNKNNANTFLPDVNNFNSFEDFFQDFFDHLKPNTKKMFS